MDTYTQAIIKEMEHYASCEVLGRVVATIFLGGGTPTILPVSLLEKILEGCYNNFSIQTNAEITVETNPATIHRQDFKRLRSVGYNRISIGAQSFNPHELKFLERIHDIEEIYATVHKAREAGFENLSLDLMFALPGQSTASWEYSLNRALGEQPEHISTYNLTIEPGTAFHKQQTNGILKMPSDNHQLAHYKTAIKTMKAAGYQHYEISNFAKPGRESRHNLNYWENGDFLGLGAGASSFLNGNRFRNNPLPSHYIREIKTLEKAVEFKETPKHRQIMGETMMLGLRLLKGINLKKFEERFGVPFFNIYGSEISSLLRRKLISIKNNQIALSEKGLYLAESVIIEFIA